MKIPEILETFLKAHIQLNTSHHQTAPQNTQLMENLYVKDVREIRNQLKYDVS